VDITAGKLSQKVIIGEQKERNGRNGRRSIVGEFFIAEEVPWGSYR
jgi:hypothetical protein